MTMPQRVGRSGIYGAAMTVRGRHGGIVSAAAMGNAGFMTIHWSSIGSSHPGSAHMAP
jgi:hypothetical protein